MTPRAGLVAFALACGALSGLEISCFNPPNADVSFSCDPDDAPACPKGYTCERDGCCHRDGSDVDAHLGECALGGEVGGATGATNGSESGTGSGTDTGSSTDSGSGTGTGTDTGTGSSGA